ncbi:MAG: hypothetical protein U0324_09435 [Polyangiales bacterium]
MNGRSWRACAAACALTCACAVEPGADGADHVVAEIAVIPTGVQCVRVVVTPAGGAAVTATATVTAGTNATVDLGAVAEGSATLAADAFTAACAAVTTTTEPAWVADPAATVIRRGYLNAVSLTFRPQTQVRVTGDFVVPVRSIFAGTDRTYAVLQDGSLRAWGSNDTASLGDGTSVARVSPVAIGGVSAVRQVAAGLQHTCAITESGQTWCWGNNANLQSGLAAGTSSSVPALVPGVPAMQSITAGQAYTCALSRSPSSPTVTTLWCWGSNSSGQFGNGTTAASVAPTAVYGGASDVVARDSTTCLLTPGLDVWCAGLNTFGQFANGGSAPSTSFTGSQFYRPEQVSVGGNGFSCARNLAGEVRCAGNNASGQLGVGSTMNSLVPVLTPLSDVVQVETGTEFACALKGDGTVWCWGRNDFGSVGVPSNSSAALNVTSPVQVAGLADVTQLALGARHACALKGDGTVWCWGRNHAGQLGDGTARNRFAPTRVAF